MVTRSSRPGCTASRRTAPRPTSVAAVATATTSSTSRPPVADTRAEHDPELRADADDLRGRIRAALDALPPKLRAVVVLRDVYDMPHEAIAAELGISESAAKVRLHRARNKLRDQLFPRREGETRAG